ncbi:MAG: phosphoribosyl-AMP cyclohydrolase [Phycisphaeraceae bacterium]|nr:phosphoribosyl-AMP cyclohydrolase [Phycisphaeraceae bacterium]|tara:strand:+ start:1234 stop:1638 length:405 start_codon:yes stop_codon:yes gene_type:complete
MSQTSKELTKNLDITYDDKGLIAAIVQDIDTQQVLMIGWMNEQAVELTLETGRATFYSRSRDKIWVKGEESGHTQEVVEARIDCDQDALLLRCRSNGPACHVGYATCFYRVVETDSHLKTIEPRQFDPADVYSS